MIEVRQHPVPEDCQEEYLWNLHIPPPNDKMVQGTWKLGNYNKARGYMKHLRKTHKNCKFRMIKSIEKRVSLNI